MAHGLDATFQQLARTENEAALDVLLAALDSPHAPSRDGALRAILERRTQEGHDEVFRRLPDLDESGRAILQERPDRLVRVATEVLARCQPDPVDDGKLGRRRAPAPRGIDFPLACEAIVNYRLYDALPAVLAVLGDGDTPESALAGQTALRLTEAFYADLSEAAEQSRQKDLEVIRHRITQALQEATSGFERHQSKDVVEAFLLIAKQQDVVLRRILRKPDEGGHAPIVELLTGSTRGGVVRLLLGFLEDPQMPKAALEVIARRADPKFVQNLLENVGMPASRSIAESLKRLKSVAWAEPGHPVFAEIDGRAQQGAVGMLMASSIDRAQVLQVLRFLLAEGKPEGRRAAAEALARFPGPEADELALRSLNDRDPEVRAQLILQLRPRGIPGVLSVLIRLVDSPSEVVRDALRKAMPEFTFRRFVTSFENMPQSLRTTAGHLVRKLDQDATGLLLKEMASPSPVRRRKAVTAAYAMGVIAELEPAVVRLLNDDDHMVRIAAAKALADSKSLPSWEALRDAMLDRSVVVREAAESSLLQITTSLSEDSEGELAESAATAG